MPSLKLTATSPVQTFSEVLTMAQLEHFLGLPTLSPVDSQRDALIESYIAGAREMAEIMQGRDLVRKQYDLRRDCFPPCAIQLREPLVSVDLVQYRDSTGTTYTLVEGTDYIVDLDEAIIQPPYGASWPSFVEWPSSAVLVRFTSGYSASDVFWSDAGARIKTGMKFLISEWFNNRLAFELGASAVQEYPMRITDLLRAGARLRQR